MVVERGESEGKLGSASGRGARHLVSYNNKTNSPALQAGCDDGGGVDG